MLDGGTKMLAHHKRIMRNRAVTIIPPAVNEDPELFIEARAQITAAAMRDTIVRFDIRIGNS